MITSDLGLLFQSFKGRVVCWWRYSSLFFLANRLMFQLKKGPKCSIYGALLDKDQLVLSIWDLWHHLLLVLLVGGEENWCMLYQLEIQDWRFCFWDGFMFHLDIIHNEYQLQCEWDKCRDRKMRSRQGEAGRPRFITTAVVCVICSNHSSGIQTHKLLYSLLRL